jgi:predicted nucleotidyltransferase
MILEHYPVERLKEEIKKVVNKHLPDKKYEIFFFGSRVDGTSNERSDIEVGILSDTEIEAEQYLDIQSDIRLTL